MTDPKDSGPQRLVRPPRGRKRCGGPKEGQASVGVLPHPSGSAEEARYT